LAWENSKVMNISVEEKSDLEPKFSSDMQQVEDLLAYGDPTILQKKF